jgi:primary-amine oxidase
MGFFMTDTAVSAAHAPGALPVHPLAPVTGAEFRAGRQVLAAAGLLADPVRFAYYGLEEPPKGEVLAAGSIPERRLRASLIDISTGESSAGQVITRKILDPRPTSTCSARGCT